MLRKPTCLFFFWLVNLLTLIYVDAQTSTTVSFTTGALTWTIPQGVTTVTVQCWGGGGAGGGLNCTACGGAGGGAGGAFVQSVFTGLTPGTSIYYSVAASRTGSNGNGLAGLDTWVNKTTNAIPTNATEGLLAKGGAGGLGAGAGTGGIAPTTGSIGTIVYKGGNGASGTNVTTVYSGAGGSSAGTSAAGNSAISSTGAIAPTGGGAGGAGRSAISGNGNAGFAPGGGGGGACVISGALTPTGGNGAPGKVSFTYVPSIFRSKQTGNWSDATTWEYSNNGGTSWFAATSAPNSNDGTITIRNTHTVTVTAAVSVDEVIVDDGGFLNINPTITLTIVNGADAIDMQVNGTLTNVGTVTTTGALAFGATGIYEHNRDGGTIPTSTWASGSTLNVTGITSTACTGLNQNFHHVNWNCPSQTVDVGILATVTWGGNFIMQASNTGYLFGSSSTTNTWNVQGNFDVQGGNVAIQSANNAGSGTLNITGNLTVTGGTFYGTYNVNSGHTLAVTGNVTVTGGNFYGTNINTSNSTCTWNFSGNVDLSGGTCGAQSIINNNNQSGYVNATMLGSNKTLKLPTTSMTSEYGRRANWSWNISSGASVTLLSDVYSHGSYDATNIRYYERGVYVTGTLIMDNYIIGSFSSVLSGSPGHNNTFQVNLGAIVKTANTNGFVSAGTNSGSVQTTTRTLNTGATYEYNGISAQVTGTGLPASISGTLKINNSAGVTLTQATSIYGNLNLTNGKLTTTNSLLLTISNTANTAISGGGTNAFINGPLKWNLTNNLSYVFPVGSTSNYLPSTFRTLNGNSGAITVQANASGSGGTYSGGIVSPSEYWQITYSGTVNPGTLTLDRQSALGTFSLVGTASSANGTYTSLGGTTSGTSITSTSNVSPATNTQYYSLMGVAATPTINVSVSSLPTFSACANTPSASQNFYISGADLQAGITVTAPYGFEISADNTSFSTSIVVGSSGNIDTTIVHLRMAAQAASPGSGSIICSSSGATTKSISVSGSVSNPVISLQSLQNATCWDVQDGSLSVSVHNGVPPYTFIWNTGQTDTFLVNMPAGYYDFMVTDANSCQAVNSFEIQAPPIPSITLNTLGLDTQTVCKNTAITTITYSTTGATGATVSGLPTGVTGSWSSNVVTISGTPTTSGTFNYTVTMTGDCTGGTNTPTGSIVVNPLSVGGSIAGGATVCSGTNSTILTLSGHTGIITKWQSSTDGGTTWTDIANTSTTYTATNLTATTQYRAVVTSGSCASANSSWATITVNLPSVGGSIAGGATVCSGTNSTILTLSGHTGTITKWQSTTDGGTTWTDIANTSTTYTATNLTATTQYRAFVTSGSCASANSSWATITVNPTTTITSQNTASQTVCLNGTLSPISLTASGSGLSYQWYSNATASTTGGSSLGTPNGAQTASYTPQSTSTGTTYYYCIVTGSCGTVTSAVSGAMVVNPNNTITLSSSAGTNAQTVCSNTAITNITYTTTGATGATVSGLPSGVTGSWASNTVTISGTPTASGTFNYTVTMTGGCTGGTNTATGTITVNSSYSGTLSVGPTGTFTSLTNAISGLTTCGYTGNIVLELQSSYVSTAETFPITFGSSLGSSATKMITIRPATGATGLIITSANATATIDLNGAQYITFDGQPGGTGATRQLSIGNTGAAPAVQFINDAQNNTVKYCTVSSSVTSTTSGLIVFSTTTGSTGNDNNTIDNCDLNGGGSAANVIYASGSASPADNSGVIISNNLIRDQFAAGTATNGVLIAAGNTDWTISGNSFYQTATRTFTTAAVHTAININNASGNNFVISNNTIGGGNSTAGGTAWTAAGTVANRFRAISLTVGTTTASSVQGNTIANFSWSSSSGATTLPGVWIGIYVSAGSANIGTTIGNIIGSATGTGSITSTISTNGGISVGIGSASAGGVINISGNTIGSINVAGSSTSVSHLFTGIWSSATSTLTINNNIIGSTSTPNSINAITASTNATAQVVSGIINSSGSTSNSITNNTIANLNNAYVPATASTTTIIRGIVASAGLHIITGNIIRNLSTAANATGTTAGASVIGISHSTSGAGQTVSQNTIYALSNTHASAAVRVYGIYYAGATTGTNSISKNNIFNLAVSSSSSTAEIDGIYYNAGLTTISNNVIRLGYNTTGSASITNGNTINGIYEVASTANTAFYFNSVYIGGSGVNTTTGTTSAFRSAVSTASTYQNNIFFNARSNATTGGKHYSIALATNSSSTSNYNDLFVSGTGGVLGLYNVTDYSTLATWQSASGKDANSISSNPNFTNATAVTPDLTLSATGGNPCDAVGTVIGSVTDDYNGATRSSNTPTDIGAYVVVAPLITVSGTLSAFTSCANTVSTAQTFTVSGSGLSANITVTAPAGFQVSNDNSTWSADGGSINITQSGGTVAATTVYLRMAALASNPTAGNVTCSSTGATTKNVSVSGAVNPNPTANAGSALSPICQGAASQMGGSVGGGASSGVWSGGAGTWFNQNNANNALYIAGASESGTITLTLTTSGGSCGTTTATKTLTVNAIPTAPTTTNSTQCGSGIPTGSITAVNGQTNANLTWYDAASSGNIVQTSYNTGSLTNYYTNNFTSSTGIGILYNDASLSGGLVQLTPNLTSKWGMLLIPASGNNADKYSITFDLNASGSLYADGVSYNFCLDPDFSSQQSGACFPEDGTGSGLSISFNEYDSDGSTTADNTGIRLFYGGAFSNAGITPSGTLLAYNSNTSWMGTSRTVVISINSSSQLSLTIGGTAIFTNVQLPSGFSMSNKSNWKHVFKSRTMGISAQHTIDNLTIQESTSPTTHYSATTWPTSISNTTTYYVTETVNGCESNRSSITLTVNLAPSITTQPSSSAQTVCQGSAFTSLSVVAAGTSLAYQWQSSTNGGSSWTTITGATSSSYNPPSSVVGSTIYRCVITNSCGSVTSNSSGALTVSASPLVNVNSTIICLGQSASLSATCSSNCSGLTYSWSPSSFLSCTTCSNPFATPSSPGNYIYTVTVTNSNGCTTTNIATVTVNSSPTISVNSASICAGGSASLTTTSTNVSTYNWSPSSGLSSTNTSNVTATPTSNTVYTVIGTSSSGCSATAYATVTVNPSPLITSITSSTICGGSSLSIPLTSNISSIYSWIANDNLNTTGESLTAQTTSTINNTITNNSTTTQLVVYTVTPTSTSGCIGSAQQVTVTVNPPSVGGSVAGSTNVCSGTNSTTLTLSGHTGSVSKWQRSADGGSTWTDIANTSATYTATNLTITTQYRAVVTSGVCSSVYSSTATVTVNPVPSVVSHPVSASICVGGVYSPSISATGGISLSYQWQYSSDNSTWNNVSDGSPANSTYTNATSPTAFSVTGNIVAGTYFYRCVISSTGSGCSTVNTNSSQLTIIDVPSISTQPSAVTECIGGTDAMSVTAAGGTPSLTYQWYSNTTNSNTGGTAVSTGGTSNSYAIPSTTAGTTYYYVTVSASGSGCASVTSNAVAGTINNSPTASISYSGPFCKSETNPQSVTLTGTNAYSGGTYIAGAGLTIDGTSGLITPSTSTAGTYTVTYTTPASGGCSAVTATVAVTITAPPTTNISYASSSFPTSASVQSVTLTGTNAYTGGTYTSGVGLTISSSSGEITPNSSTAGTYTVTYITPSSGGCSVVSATVSIAITNNSPTDIAITSNSATCGNSNGSITLGFVTGGVSPYTYSLNGGTFSSTTNYTNLSPGTYTITVKDANASTYTKTTSIANVSGPTAVAVTPTNASCGSANGSIAVGSVTGGTSPYTYSLNGGTFLSTTNYTSLNPGTYTVTVKDANACTYSSTATVNNISGPTDVVLSATNSTCGAANGSISIGTVTGGVSPFTYSVSSISGSYVSTTNFTGIVAATYTVNVKDANNCVFTKTVIVNNTAGPTAVSISPTNGTCGNANGSIAVGSVTGGTSPYTYSLNGGTFSSTTNYTSLNPGTYTVIVKDANACTYSSTSTVNNISGPTANGGPALSPICQGATSSIMDGSVGGSATGGTWSGGAGTWVNANDPTNAIYTAGVSESGIITFTLTTSGGSCGTITTTKNLTINPKTTITSQSTASQTVCLNDSLSLLSVTATGSNLTYQWYSISYPTGSVFCNGPTAVIDVTNPTTGKTWMDRNLGASQVATSSTDVSAYGDLYQWGRRSDGHQCRNSNMTTTLSSSDNPSNDNFILTAGNSTTAPYGDWLSSQNNNLWQGVNGVNNPCPSGYRLPSQTELENERISWNTNTADGAFSSLLKWTAAGYRYCFTTGAPPGIIGDAGIGGNYWSNTVNSTNSFNLRFVNIAFLETNARAYGFSVRCIKDVSSSSNIGGATGSSYIPSSNIAGANFYYVIVNGTCGSDTSATSGAIIVNPNNSITLSSAAGTNAQTVCNNTSITTITYATTGATGATVSGLPTGVTGSWSSNVFTISGAPTVSGTFNYTVTMTGGCTGGTNTATGNIVVSASPAITSQSTAAQTVCLNDSLSPLSITATGSNLTYQWYNGPIPQYPTGSVFCNGPTAIVDITNPVTGKTWMDRNLGATQVATSSNDVNAYGDLYQWGRGSDGHQCRNSATTSTLSSTDQPGHGDFILATTSTQDWLSPQNNNLWQGLNGVNNPCPSGYRLPSSTELDNERLSWVEAPINSTNTSIGAFNSPLKFTLAGNRNRNTGEIRETEIYGMYRTYSVEPINLNSFALFFNNTDAVIIPENRAYGFTVRCIKEIINSTIIGGATGSSYTPSSSISGTNNYYVIVTGTCGSDTSAISGEIIVKPIPAQPTISNNSPLTVGGTLYINTNSNASNFFWSGPNGFTSNLQNPQIINVTPAAAGTYSLYVEQNSCISPTATVNVSVDSICIVNIPDVNFKTALVNDTTINTNQDGEIQCAEAIAYTGGIIVPNLNINDLTGIEAFRFITELNCSNNNLTSLNLTQNGSLTALSCNFNQLTSLDLSSNVSLVTLNCFNNQLSSLQISNNISLGEIYCQNNQLTAIDFSMLSNLGSINCSGNQFASLDLSSNSNLISILSQQNNLTTLKINNGNNINLVSFDAKQNPNLRCITVDSTLFMQTNWLNAKDITANYNENCTLCDSMFVQANTSAIQVCAGVSVTLTSGGTATNTSWNNGVSDNIPFIPSITSFYTVIGTDANNCIDVDSVLVKVNPLPDPTITSTVNNVPSNTVCSGNSINIEVLDSLQFNWQPGNFTTSIIQVAPTTTTVYTLTSTSLDGCQSQKTFTVNVASSINIYASSSVTDCGNSNGFVRVDSVIGGTAPFIYQLSNDTISQSSPNFLGLQAGNYTVSVTDANFCTVSANLNIGPVQPIVVGISGTNLLCAPLSNASLTANVNGGTAPYQYNWLSVGNTTPVLNGLSSGTYTVVIYDVYSCSASQTITITEPAPITISLSNQINVSCNGLDNGSAIVNASGGSGNLTATWNTTPVQTGVQATNLFAGNYVVTVNDTNNCQATLDVVISEPTPFTASVTYVTNINCNGATSGSAAVAGNGGVAPYFYSWSTTPVQSNDTAFNLSSGNYTVTVYDFNNCTSFAYVNITQSNAVVADISSQTNINCFGNANGSATVNALGGNGPLTYSWNTNPVQSGLVASNLLAGSYTVTVSDTVGCSDTAVVNITQPTQLNLSIISQTDAFGAGQNNGTATVSASGGVSPYNYSWSHNAQDTSNFVTDLPSGTHFISVTDANACSDTSQITIGERSNLNSEYLITKSNVALQFNIFTNDPTMIGLVCDTLSILQPNYGTTQITSIGNVIYTPSLNFSGYDKMVIRACNSLLQNCLNDTIYITVNPNAQKDYLTTNGYANAAAATGNVITNDAGTGIQSSVTLINNVTSGTLQLDANGNFVYRPNRNYCGLDSFRYQICDTNNLCSTAAVYFEVFCRDVKVFTGFSPNGDGINDNWLIADIEGTNNKVSIFDRWGRLVNSFTNYDNANVVWDGKNYDGNTLISGTYFYLIEIENKPRKLGWIEITR